MGGFIIIDITIKAINLKGPNKIISGNINSNLIGNVNNLVNRGMGIAKGIHASLYKWIVYK